MDKLASMQSGSPEYADLHKEIERWEREKERIQDILTQIGEDYKKKMADLAKQYEHLK